MNDAAEKVEEPTKLIVHGMESFGSDPDGSYDEVEAINVIHKVPDILSFWKELYRVLKPKGKALIVAPFAKSNRSWLDPETKRGIFEETFQLLNKSLREQNKVPYNYGEVNFEFTLSYEGVDGAWAVRSEEARNFAFKHYWNIAQELKAFLTKV